MADISKDELRKEISAILKDADLQTTSAKKVRQQIEEKLEVDLSERKKEIDELVMESKRAPPKKPAAKRKKGSSDDDESGSNEDASDEEYSPKKAKTSPKKGKAGKKGKKGKGGDSDSDSDWGKAKKPSGGAKKGGGGKGSGYTRAITLSADLAAVVGAKQMARHEVVKKVWGIIKERNLYDPKNKQYAICDDDLMKVMGVKRFRTFGMMKYLKNHFVD
ncbi:hypothetical protein QAD02_022541 [Eretmocerus hayati]|uniref:Uncharacterized protein n=1 Tax=Eretmocerus hayati TaxID=131215 RepID=A0ACC2PTK8_9HYME|nr:hypothetical protein QAD02_022541 [Eretmocerus hayati]